MGFRIDQSAASGIITLVFEAFVFTQMGIEAASQLLELRQPDQPLRILADVTRARTRDTLAAIHALPDRFLALGFVPDDRIAILYISDERDHTFLEAVAQNRKLNIRTFTDHDEATRWLSQ